MPSCRGWPLWFLVGLLGGWLAVSRNILKRIDGVTKTSRVIMAGDLSGRVPIDGSGDEFDRLAVNLNAMLDRIEQLMNGLREVSDNIAHDLKTPLSRMRNRVETALYVISPAWIASDVLEKTIEESDELIRTFNALLSIARLEAGSNSTNFALNDLQELVGDVAELYEPLAEQNNMQLYHEAADHRAQINVDRQLLGQAIANLIENALKYGGSLSKDDPSANSARGKITIEAGVHPSNGSGDQQKTFFITMAVMRGRALPAKILSRAMKRFGRLEKSRSKPGTGLGPVACVSRRQITWR